MLNKLTEFYQEKGLSHVVWQCLLFLLGGLFLVSPLIEYTIFTTAHELFNQIGILAIIWSFTFLIIAIWIKNRATG